MFISTSTLAAFTVLAHYLTIVTAAPIPFGLSDIVDGIGELFNTDLINNLLSNDQDAVASKAVSSAISGSEFLLYSFIYIHVPSTELLYTQLTISPNTIALSPDLFPDILYFAEFSGAAYCDPKNIPGQRVSCTEDVCPTVQANVVTTIAEFDECV